MIVVENRDAIPLVLELRLAGQVNSSRCCTPGAVKGADLADHRRKDVEVHLHAWKRLIDAIDPKWDPNERLVGPNGVMPPAGVPRAGGMDPAGIKDPVLRAQYEEAIRANNEKNARWGDQYALRNHLKWFPKLAEGYIVMAYSTLPFDLPELEQYLKTYMADEASTTRILAAVTKNMQNPTGMGATFPSP